MIISIADSCRCKCLNTNTRTVYKITVTELLSIRTIDDHLLYVPAELHGDVAQRGEDDDAGEHAGHQVHQDHHHRVQQDRAVLELVVAGERDHGAESDAHRVEVLSQGVHPHLAMEDYRRN